MGLNIFGFQTEFKPHYSHQFKVQISNSDATDNNVVEYNVKSIKLPQFSINTEKRNYGNTSLGLPVFSFGDQYLEITFVETENFIVLETFLSKMSWTSSSPISKTYIIVEEYDETMSTLIRKHRYIGRVVEVGNPSWQRSGSAGYIELTVKFLVDSNKIEGATTNTFVGVAASNTVKQNNDLTGETLDEGRDYAAAQSEYASFENNVRNSIDSAMASAQQAEDQQRQAAQNQTQELDAERQRQDDANRAIKAAEEAQKKQQEQQAAPAVPGATPAPASTPAATPAPSGGSRNALQTTVPGTKGGTGSGRVYNGASGDRYDIALQGIATHEGNGGYKVYHHSGDVPTIGYGVTASAMRPGETDFYLKTKSGSIVHINDKKSIDEFRSGKYDGATLTNSTGTADKAEQDKIARKIAKNVVKKYEATAKDQAKKAGLNWNSLTEAQKGALIDGAYNGKSIAYMSAKLMKKKQEGKQITKEEARRVVDATMTRADQQRYHGGWANRVYDNAMV